jgi:hypothetical protein
MERLASYKNSSLTGAFTSYEENKVLRKQLQGLYSQNFEQISKEQYFGWGALWTK